MFLDNKYTRWYYNIINNRKVNKIDECEYQESHHIIPRSLGGSDDSENLVNLSGKEHYLVHLLLINMLEPGNERNKMAYALSLMGSFVNNGHISAKQFENVRRYASFALKGIPRSEETKQKIREARAKQVITEETKELWRKNRRGKPKSEEHKRKISEANIGKHSVSYTEERRKKQSLALTGKNLGRVHRIVQCPHCGKEGGLPIMKRHHFDNCKFIIDIIHLQ
jgi:hypothetical protein